MKTRTRLDLNEFRSGGSRVFAGRERGSKVREVMKLDELDQAPGSEVEVVVPDDVFSVNSSFFLGLFGPSIRALGPERFRQVYSFTGRPITRVMEAGIQEASATESPFGR